MGNGREKGYGSGGKREKGRGGEVEFPHLYFKHLGLPLFLHFH